MLLVFYAVARGPLGTHDAALFSFAIQAYMALSGTALMVGLGRPERAESQAILAVTVDIFMVTVLMYASGGVQSGLGMLIAIAIALGAISMAGRNSLTLAAIASLAILTEEVYGQLQGGFNTTAYVQAGLLGISFFALAALAHKLASRALQSEELAHERGLDLANMAQLNDYVIRQMRAGILVVNDQSIVQIINDAAWVLLGMPTAMRHHPLEQVSPELADQYHHWEDTGQHAGKSFRATPGGRDIRATFTHLGEAEEASTLIVLEDTATLTAQAQHMKLASLGRLTAGIAHEIRNPLGAISHAAQLLDESPDLVQADKRMADIIQQNSTRVNEVIASILKLSRQDLPKPKPLVLAPWLEKLAEEVRSLHTLNDQQITLHVDPPGTTVFADSGQLHQILDVLCDNARRHFSRPIEELRLQILAGITPESGGPFIEVHDNGSGISQKSAEQLFEPFFTTRNEGTGLGLYIAQQLSEANRSRLEYLPLPNGGSCFRLSFPNPKLSTP